MTNDRRFIPVAAPTLGGNEKKYVNECLDTTWISSAGRFIEEFERGFADFCGTRHAVACSNGTTALHLALLALGVGPGDEVIVPTLTFIASANAVSYCGGVPVFVDIDPETWCIDPALVRKRITHKTRGIIAVPLFGHPVDMDPIMSIAREHELFVLEDAAQAHGAVYKGRRAGALGDVATFSFFGNKIISTGEGGMITTDDADVAAQARLLRSHGMDPSRRYWHPVIGFNYRMTNVAAAIGVAQLERVDWQLARRREVVGWYKELLADADELTWQIERPDCRHAWWMFTAVLNDELPVARDEVIARMAESGIETRPVVYPLHQLPPYRESSRGYPFPVADRIAKRGINLPTWAGLTREDVELVCEQLLACLRERSVAPVR